MKKTGKIISAILSLFVAAMIISGASTVFSGEISVEVDGKTLELDTSPQVINNRVMVPVRQIFEEVGALLKWDNETQQVSARKGAKTVMLKVGSSEMTIDKGKTDDEGNPILETVSLDAAPQIVSGRTLVPVRAIAESFGLSVSWNGGENKVEITSKEADDSWKENKGTIDLSALSYEGEGVEIKDNRVIISRGGDFEISGKLKGGGITVSTDERVKLRLCGAEIISTGEPCIFIENADKAYITLSEGESNSLTATNCENAAVYSKDNLSIKGSGELYIKSDAHGIKAAGNLTIENGNIKIDALSDGLHIDNTFKMTNGTVEISATGDGVDSESIVYITGGKMDISTNATPVLSEGSAEFEKSSKGIAAEWLIYITGGEISVNSASHAIHCADEIQIDGGDFEISSNYEKGISAHGNLTINGSDTKIDIKKSTEGIESKNILTVNDGTIKVTASDDALNATGGNSGKDNEPLGGFRGNRQEKPSKDFSQTEAPRGGGFGKTKPQGEMPQMPQGEAPQMPQGEAPQMPQGEMPQMPQGEAPQMPQGEAPQMPQGEMPQGGGRDMKNCLVINGGYLELYAEDDCLDSNGNLVINGGTIKASNPNGSFSGAFAVIDPDGKTTISENATLIFAASSGDERSLNLSQGTIIVYLGETHAAGDKITVSSGDDVIYEYSPSGKFGAVLISSKALKVGESYKVTVGSESYDAVISSDATVLGERTAFRNFGR